MTERNTPERVVAARLAQMRGKLGWSQDELARRMDLYGIAWSRTTVAKIETHTRQVTVDELVALAFVFGIPPAALLTPVEKVTVNVTPSTQISSEDVWSWQMGALPMGGSEPGTIHRPPYVEADSLIRRYDEACPDNIAAAERRLPGIRRLARRACHAQNVAGIDEHNLKRMLPSIKALLQAIEDDAKTLRRDATRLLNAKSKGTKS